MSSSTTMDTGGPAVAAHLALRLADLGARRGDRLLVAVSGGADSLALLRGCLEAAPDLGLCVSAAHLDHGVRGERSADQARRVEAICRALRVPLRCGRLDARQVGERRRRWGSLEAGLRELRYAFLESAAEAEGARWILTAHHADDQAETILFRSLRRDDWRALAGTPPRRGRVLRPLLEMARTDLLSACRAAGLEPLHDESNEDRAIARNRLRADVLPSLGRGFHPDTKGLLLRMGEAARTLAAWERRTVLALLSERPAGSSADPSPWRRLPPPLLPGAVALAVAAEAGRSPGRRLLRDLVALVRRGASAEVALPGGRVMLLGGRAAGEPRRPLPVDRAGGNGGETRLEVPGRVEVPGLGVSIVAEEVPEAASPGGGPRVQLRAEEIALPLAVRTRRRGDRFEPLGLGRGKSLSRFLMDRKVPLEERDRLPLVLDATGRILWVAGVEIAHWARCRGTCPERVLSLTLCGPDP